MRTLIKKDQEWLNVSWMEALEKVVKVVREGLAGEGEAMGVLASSQARSHMWFAPAGFNRGGASVLKDAYWETAGEHYSLPIRLKQATGFGVQGGGDGIAGACWLFEADDPAVDQDTRLMPIENADYRRSKPIAGVLHPDDKSLDPKGEYFYYARQPMWHSRYITNGGGGYGDPFTRDPARVLKDVRDGYVSIVGAARDYGVVVDGDPENDPEGLVLNENATTRLRQNR